MQSLERPAYQGASGLGLKIPGAELALILASIQACVDFTLVGGRKEGDCQLQPGKKRCCWQSLAPLQVSHLLNCTDLSRQRSVSPDSKPSVKTQEVARKKCRT